MNQWMKRALGVAVLGGGLLAFSAGAASAQEVSADASARLGRSTEAQARVCADGRVLSRLLGSCSGQAASGTGGSAHAGDGRVGASVRLPRASGDVSVATRRNRPRASVSGGATAAPRSGGTRADADAAADTSPSARARVDLSRPGSGDLLDLADPAPAPAGIGVLGSGPIASGNQVDASVGDVSPTVPVTVCGNGVGVLGDASASCGGTQQTGTTGPVSGSAGSGTGSSTGTVLLDDLGSGNQVDAGIGSISPAAPVTVCGNSAGVLGDASASCGGTQQTGTSGSGTPAPGTTIAGPSVDTGGIIASLPAATTPGSSVDPGGISPSLPAVTIPGLTGVDSGGIVGPSPVTTPPPTGTTGITGTSGLVPGAGSGLAGLGGVDAFAPFRGLAPAGSGALPFTGGASDLLGLLAFGLLAAGALFLRATRPVVASVEGGGDR